MKPVTQDTVCQIAQEGDYGNTQEHSENSAQAATDGNGYDDPQRFQTSGVTENLRSQNQSRSNCWRTKMRRTKIRACTGEDQKQNDGSGNGADETAKIRNRFVSYDDTDQYRIGRQQNTCKKAQTRGW